jgi:hypothetical protein
MPEIEPTLHLAALADARMTTMQAGRLFRAAGNFLLLETATLPAVMQPFVAECIDILFEPVWQDRDDDKDRMIEVGLTLFPSVRQEMRRRYGATECGGQQHYLNPENDQYARSEWYGGAFNAQAAVDLTLKHVAMAYKEAVWFAEPEHADL